MVERYEMVVCVLVSSIGSELSGTDDAVAEGLGTVLGFHNIIVNIIGPYHY